MDIQFKREFREAIEGGRKDVTRRPIPPTITRGGREYHRRGVERNPHTGRWEAHYLAEYREDSGMRVSETLVVPCRYDVPTLRPRYGPRFSPEYGAPLEVVSVRPETLREITDEDAKREAIGALGYSETFSGFVQLWFDMYARAKPWACGLDSLVWRVEFRRRGGGGGGE